MTLITSVESSPPSSPSRHLTFLVAATIVREYDRSFLPTPVADLAEKLGISAERVSRLKGRILPGFTRMVEDASRPGRPSFETIQKVDALEQRVALLEELLDLASAALADAGIRGRPLQDRLVVAYERLAAERKISFSAFCKALGIPERSFREWVRRSHQSPAPPSTPPPAPKPKPPSRKPSRRRGRFALATTLPGLQLMADTTPTEVLSVPLMLVATQDPGARDQQLLGDFSLATTETAELVASTVDLLFEKLPGLQFVTDQGKPYMAKLIQDLCEAREVEHAPTPEATPTAKATLERAFGTIKSALAPLLQLTCRAAEAFPVLRDRTLALSLGTLLFAVGLRIYNLASRERPRTESTRSADPEVLAAIAEEQRQKARSEFDSRRLLLEKIHREYGMPGSQEAFVRRFRSHHSEDLREAMMSLSRIQCCCRIQAPDRYFAAILWRVSSEGRSRRARRSRQTIERAEARQRAEEQTHERSWLEAHPADWVLRGLEAIANQYRPELGNFAAGGHVFGLAPLRKALEHLVASTALRREAVLSTWSRWYGLHADADPVMLARVKDVFDSLAVQVLAAASSTTRASPTEDLGSHARMAS